jgi:hypothetical protein
MPAKLRCLICDNAHLHHYLKRSGCGPEIEILIQIALWNQIAIEPSDLLLTKSWRCYDIMIKRDDRSTAALLPCSASHVRCRCFPWRDGDWHPNINFSVWPIQPAGVRIL